MIYKGEEMTYEEYEERLLQEANDYIHRLNTAKRLFYAKTYPYSNSLYVRDAFRAFPTAKERAEYIASNEANEHAECGWKPCTRREVEKAKGKHFDIDIYGDVCCKRF